MTPHFEGPSTMASQAVHWEEGMFLSPQHFQAADRHARRALREVEDWFQPFSWGYRSLSLDEGALASSQVKLKSCQARFKDGTHLTVGEGDEADVPALTIDLAAPLKSNERVEVYLAVPEFNLGVANVEPSPTPRGPRFVIEVSDDCVDENSGKQPKSLKYRKLQARLMHGDDDLNGYEILPLARIQRGPEPGSPAELIGKTVPALLALDAWPWLRDQVGQIARDVRARLRQLAEMAFDREISFRSQDPGDAARLLKLAALNEIEPPLALLSRTPGVPPLPVYLELCRAAGRLGLFLRERRLPDLPPYKHDNLGSCFTKVIEQIRLGMEETEPIRVESMTLSRVNKHLQAALQESWCDLKRLFLAVETDLTTSECDDVMKDRQVDRTIASGIQVEELYTRGSRGLALMTVNRPDGLPPRSTTPHLPNIVYYQIDGQERRFWQSVENHRTFAIRFNIDQAPFVSDEEVRVPLFSREKQENKTGTLRFTLHVKPLR